MTITPLRPVVVVCAIPPVTIPVCNTLLLLLVWPTQAALGMGLIAQRLVASVQSVSYASLIWQSRFVVSVFVTQVAATLVI